MFENMNIDIAGIDMTGQYSSGDRQIISITDLISEGPIYGLVDAQASIYLNDDRAAPFSQSGNSYSSTPAKVRLTSGSNSAVIVGGGSAPVVNATNGDKYLIVRGVHTVYINATNGSTSDSNGNVTATLTTNGNSNFFTDNMISSGSSDLSTLIPARLTATTGTTSGSLVEGSIISRASQSVATFMPGAGSPQGLIVPAGQYFLQIDRIVKISSVSGAVLTLESNWGFPTTGSYQEYGFDVSGAIVSNADVMSQTEIKKYKSVTSQFRVGTLDQPPFTGYGGVGSTSITNNPSAGGTLERSNNYGGSQAPKELLGSSAAGFNLTAAQLQEVDEAVLTISYPNGLYAVSGKGTDKHTYIQYKVEIAIKKPGSSDFDGYISLHNPLQHSGLEKNAISFVTRIDLDQYRPFSDFKVKVSRISNHTGPGYKYPNETYHDWQNVSSSSLGTVTCIIKDILTYPFTSLAKTTFDTKQFQSVPTRSYHAKGLKVLVPSNYVTRDQSSDGIANYKRNISTSAIESTYQDWDGSFAVDKVYTNNPAWVFYDILTNDRYGLGDFLKSTDIDKYSLYRIARYCDQMVPDGKGGEEPRFTANLYLTKAADAFKVIKDIATTFRSMIYFFDGQVTPVQDAPSGPVYNFTKANVKDGQFTYESTGSKTRINQVIVTWINPDSNYKAEPLIVEDRLNIAETGRIISQSAVAMGATSEGQAMRYGRWKLWTAANQREVVTFSSALNSTFLIPGDIVNIQDADRYAVRLGGRISNTGSRTTSTIPLDNPTTLNSNSVYKLSVIFTEPAAFATSDVTIGGINYKVGDEVKQAFIDGDGDGGSSGNGTYTLQDINTEQKAQNAKASATSTEALVLTWADTTRVETKEVDTGAGLVSSLTIKTSGTDENNNAHTVFSSVPDADSIWVLKEEANNVTVAGSSKEYKILALQESSKGEITFSAVEHYDEKFAAVDIDFTTFIADTVYPTVTSDSIVPPPLDVFSTSLMKPEQVGEELRISWTAPTNVGDVPGEYEHLFGFEITHDFPDIENPVRISDSQQRSWKIDGIEDGNYNVAIRTINVLNNLSEATRASVTVSDKYKENIPRLPEGVPYKGTTSVGFGLISTNFTFKRYDYAAKSPSADSTRIINTNQTATAWSQSCAGLPAITWSEGSRNSSGQFITEHAYILLDASDSTDRLKLLKYHKPGLGVSQWYDTGNGSGTERYASAASGTVSKSSGSSKVTGSSTSFLTQFAEGDIIKIGNTSGYKVASIVSDTLLYVSNPYGSTVTGVSIYPPNIRIDYVNDTIIARVYRTSAGLVLAETYTTIDSELKPAGDIIQADGISTEEIAENAVTVTEIDTTSETGGTFGAAVAALDAASFTSIDTDVLDANSVIAREVQVFPSGQTPPTISGTTLAGAGIDLKQDGDMYVGNAAANKYLFWDQSAGTMTFRGTLNVDDIVGSSATFATLMAEVATIGTLNTKMLDSDAIVTRDIRVGPSVEVTAGSFVTNTEYYITDLGNTTQAQWNSVAGTSGQTYNLGSIFTAQNAGTGTGKARNRTTVAKIAGTTLTGAGAHLNSDGDFYLGNKAANKYVFWDQSAGTMDIRGQLNADDINAGTIDATKINVANLSSINANIGAITAGTIKGDTMPDANAAPSGAEKGAFLDLTAGKMVFGNASKFILWDGTNLTISGVTITAAQLSGSTGFASETYVDNAISDLVGTASASLDTLGEIATALNNDADLNTTLTTSIATKLPKAGGQMTGNITFSSTQTVDGRDLSVDGAKLDTISSGATNTAAPFYTSAIAVGDGGLTQKNFTTTLKSKLDGIAASATNTAAPYYTSAIAVGDGGLTQKNFTTTLKSKLDGIAASATNTAAPYYTSAIPNATASQTGLATSTQITKLDGIAAGATNVTNNNQLTNGAGYITNADGGNAATFGGSLPSAYVKTDQAEALGSATNVLTINGSTITLTRGDGSTDTVTTPNTEYTVGDGGLTQKNFTTTLKSKLDGIAASATNTAAPFYTSAIAVGDGGLTQKNFTTTLKSKLDGIAASATNTAAPYYTSAISVGDGGLTQKNFTTTLKSKLDGIAASANNYSFPYTIDTNATANTVVRRGTSGYIFAVYYNGTGTFSTSGNASGMGMFTGTNGSDNYGRSYTAAAARTLLNVADGANAYVHPNEGVDYGAANTGANIISDVTVNAKGHVTGFTNRALTLLDLGYSGATNATANTGTTTPSNTQTFTNKSGNISQWTNDSNYVTSSGVTSVSGTAPIASTGGTTPAISVAANSASSAGVVAAGSGNNNKVWQTNGSGVPAWRDAAATGVTSVTATTNTGLTVTNSTTTPVITLDSTLTSLGNATFDNLNVEILDADKILTRDIRVGPTGQTSGVDNAAKINGTTLTGTGAALNSNGDFFVGDSASAHMFFDQSAGSLAMKSGTSGARTEIVGGTTKVYDASGNVRVIIGDLS